ncbi:glycoside hydrolase family protein [Echinicola sp. CAU 1574]|uniref:Glycoside hydrolase family protein n=1 Tax=Echinicola arenosa TaxID=2774144 RepID=A0ABR9AJR4_9BACT|nr:glycoside hydrolase family protein [Echinicola arenosa]MBD8489001.1 glycoside hydrolase family protein [Echinicola arenosa]
MRLGSFDKVLVFSFLIFVWSCEGMAQVVHRERPEKWNELVLGGRFLDRFDKISPIGELVDSVWGAANVIPRYMENGIEDKEWSYWGGNIVYGKDQKYHLFICRWPESSSKGHMEWPNSTVVHAVCDNSEGPFEVVEEIGKGHNPEIFQLQDGRFIIYVIDGYYISENLGGPWEYGQFEFDPRDRPIIEGLSNLSFARREDGSYLMVCRGGGIWLSKDGLSSYQQLTNERVYPPVDGRFEDPVIWKDHIQYHMIVNDWLGRIAFYLRSKDGVHWKTDPGEAYQPGITVYKDGVEEDWFKYERLKIFQDGLGRAVQANFAVIDTLKHEDKPGDNHSSKNIGIPLTVGRQIELLNKKITENTREILVIVKAEPGFDPKTDMDFSSLRFGASEVINFGGGSVLLDTKERGEDLILIFEAEGHAFNEDNFAGKLLGKDAQGKLLFGYSRLPWVNYLEPMLSTTRPRQIDQENKWEIEVMNFGQVSSEKTSLKLEVKIKDEWQLFGDAQVRTLNPFEKETVIIMGNNGKSIKLGDTCRVVINNNTKSQELFVME